MVLRERNTENIEELGQRFNACPEAVAWARSNCKNAQEIWQKADDEYVVWIACQRGILTSDELRKFSEWCLKNTPAEEPINARVRKALDNPNGLSYPPGMTAERWSALAMAQRGRVEGDAKDARRQQAKFLRSLCRQPFA